MKQQNILTVKRDTCKNLKKSENGITLIALVVTIIVLLILAGITVTYVLGPDGIISQAQLAAKRTRIGNYQTVLETLRAGVEPDKIVENLTSKQFMDRFQQRAEKEAEQGALKDARNVERLNDDTVRVETKEGDLFDITEDGVEYRGNRENIPDAPNLQTEDIEIHSNPSEPTNGEVKVTITLKNPNSAFTLQYAKKNKNETPSESDWKDYEEGTEIIFKQNGLVFARLLNELREPGTHATGNIDNIDKLNPEYFTPKAEATTNSITVKGHTTDKPADDKYSSSGIEEYYFKEITGIEESIENADGWKGPVVADGENDVSYPFTELTQGTSHTFVMKAVDEAGNETISNQVQINTKTVPGLTGGDEGVEEADITFTASPTTDTNGSVTVTIKQNKQYPGYTLQYAQKNKNESPEAKDWHDYEEGKTKITLTQNGNVFARLRDNDNQGSKVTATKDISNIDKLPPKTFTVTATANATTITVKGHTSDEAATTAYKSSGIKEYYFKKVGKDDSDEIIKQSNDWQGPVTANGTGDVSYTFKDLAQETTHYFVMKAKDNAGNETITGKIAPPNAAPVLTSENMIYNTKTTDSLTINAKATDANGDKLTYTLYAGKDKSKLDKVSTAVAQAQNVQVTLKVTGLSPYTDYYYKVEVSDGKLTASQTSTTTIKTYCPGTGLTCSGPFWTDCPSCLNGHTTETCGTCNGTGSVTVKNGYCPSCNGNHYNRTCPSCKGAGGFGSGGKCTHCGGSGYLDGGLMCAYCGSKGWNVWKSCTSCGGDGKDVCTVCSDGWAYTTQTCGTCKGSRKVSADCSNCRGSGGWSSPCTHEKTSTHQYCSHGKTSQHDTP